MEHGDLAVSTRPRQVVVIEGVLASVTPVLGKGLFRQKVTAWNLHWHDLALKRCVTMKRRYPDYGLDLVTFIDPRVADEAADFLESIGFPHDAILYAPLRQFAQGLPYRDDIVVIYDSDEDRLDSYGQLGHAVVKGADF